MERKFPSWGDLGIIIAAAICAQLLGGVCGFALNLFGVSPAIVLFCSYVIGMGLTLAFIIIYRKQRSAPKLSLRQPYRKLSPLLLLWGVVLMIVASVVIEPILNLMPDYWMKLVSDGIGHGGWAILTTVVAAPILEELVFRGYILGSVRAKSGTIPAIVISAAMFGLIHMVPQQIVAGFVMGLILGYIYVRTGSLVIVILMHTINNALAYVQMQLGAESLREMITNNTLYWILYGAAVVIAVVATVGIVKALKKMVNG